MFTVWSVLVIYQADYFVDAEADTAESACTSAKEEKLRGTSSTVPYLATPTDSSLGASASATTTPTTTPPTTTSHIDCGTCPAGVNLCCPDTGKLELNDSNDKSEKFCEDDHCRETEAEDGLMNHHKEAGTLTDVCNVGNLPEVEILSLIEEKIPKYRLRADTITSFAGYENEDWIQTPIIPHDIELDLTEEQIEETLKYFVLCSERLTQMTRTYNDIEAVTRLLEEKERDLELAARLGQILLDEKKELAAKNEHLEEQLAATIEKNKQLSHDISMKDDLLKIYTQDGDTDSNGCSPTKDRQGLSAHLHNFDTLQKKLRSVEEENFRLRTEAVHLETETINYEEKEQQLVKDLLREMGTKEKEFGALEELLARKTEEAMRQQEEITNLLAQVVDMQKKNKELVIENAELQKHLLAAQDAQKDLTEEIQELDDKYQETLDMLHAAQEDIRLLRSKSRPRAMRQHYSAFSPYFPRDSLASELESSLKNEYQYPDGNSPSDRNDHNWRVMQTYRYARRATSRGLSSRSMSRTPGSGSESCDSPVPTSSRSSMYLSEGESIPNDGYAADSDSTYGTSSSRTQLGRPGIPGSNDLETALRRLTLRSQTEQAYLEGEKERRERRTSGGSSTPTQSHTPDSLMSGGSFSGMSSWSGYALHGGGYAPGFRIPEKLQIVKPIEGSATLHQWQRLATPHLGGIFEERPGVQTKGERKLDMEEEVYSLSDFEEDEVCNPGKCCELASFTFTLTDSKIIHPDQNYAPVAETVVTSSAKGSISSVSSVPNLLSPQGNKGTSTFSMSLGLAATLQERGITAAKTWEETLLNQQGKQTLGDKDGLDKPTEGSPIRYNYSLSNLPGRFPSIVTETIYDATKMASRSSAIYTSATTNCTYSTTASGLSSFPSLGSMMSSSASTGSLASSSVTKPASALDLTHVSIMDKILNIGISRIMTSDSNDDIKKDSTGSHHDPHNSKPPLAPLSIQIDSPTETQGSKEPSTPPNSPTFMISNPLLQLNKLQFARGPELGIYGSMPGVNPRKISKSKTHEELGATGGH